MLVNEEEMIFCIITFSKMWLPCEDGFVVNGHIITMYNVRVSIVGTKIHALYEPK